MGDTIAQTGFENVSKTSNDLLLAGVNTPQSDEDSLKLKELMKLCTNLQNRVIDLEKTKTSQAHEITSLKRRVKRLEKKGGSRTYELKRLYKVGLSRRVESSYKEDMFTVQDLVGDEVVVKREVAIKVASTIPVSAATTTAHGATTTTTVITNDEITLAKAVVELKSTELEQESIKKQKVDEDNETTELQRLIEVVHDKEEVAINDIPLVTKPPSIVDWKIHKEGKKSYYQIIRADGSSKIANKLKWNNKEANRAEEKSKSDVNEIYNETTNFISNATSSSKRKGGVRNKYYTSGLGHKTKKEWVKELNYKHRINFLALQETKMDCISHMDVKYLWGNSNFDFVASDSLGNSGGILYIWEASIFKKDGATISDNFIAIYGTWLARNVKILLVAVYAPQQPGSKRALWDFLSNLVRRWNGEAIIMGDFNDVRTMDERLDVQVGKALCLDRHLSDHRPILLREVLSDFGPTPFRFYQSWLRMEGFDSMVEHAWLSFSHSDSNAMVRFKKKLQDLKSIIRLWVKDKKFHLHNAKNSLQNDLISIDKDLERGNVSDDILLNRMDLNRRLQDIKLLEVKDLVQKSKIKWAIEGDENSKFFHGIINKKRSQLSIRGVFVEGTWCTDPSIVKEAFKNHFEVRFQQPCHDRLKLNAPFHNRLSSDQVDELDRAVSRDEIRRAVWNCGENKSPGPDGYTFEFFRKYWSLVGADFCDAVDYFFKSGTFPRGCNSSFIALIPKVNDAKFVNDFRPISLIGCVYKVITKVLANRLATVISDLVSETQSAFVANRQILDGPFILNEMLNWCKRKKKQAMFFKVDFAKAYDSVRWDYLLDILHAFGFGPNWCRWIRGTFTSSMASILVNGSPTSEFPFCCGLKQGDPLAPYLFILIMESLHISFSRVVDDGLFKGFQLHGSVNISHLFYADDAMFIGEWSEQNLHNIVKVLNCFHLASGLKINIAKSQVLGVGVSQNVVVQAANRIGCAVLNTPFRYLGVTVGECMSRKSAWVGLVNKLQARLSKWKVKTLSIGGRLTLLKSVLGASPIYYMSIFKVPKGVLKTMESIRSKFFNGVDSSDRKISWVAWDNVLASKLNGGLGVSSFFALNRALLLKWVWRFISGDGSLWCKVIQAIYGSKFDLHVTDQPSIWCSILREVKSLKDSGFDFSSHCKKRIGDGSCTSFWYDIWLADAPLCVQFPRLFALELDKEIVVANKMGASSVSASFRRDVRDGAERQQWDDLSSIMNSVVLSSSKDRWTCDLSGDGEFKVKVIRNFIDDLFLPSSDVETRWVKFIPIKVNVFSWRARRDRLPTRVNLSRRGVLLDSHLCPLCNAAMEDVQHVFFRCDVARVVLRKICRWWDLDWQEICSFSDWDAWFLSFRLSSRLKSILEGVFYVAWWRIWRLRN
ncbi:RNA-directed DNA polymerase, eukaryota [Tanacetum coccineum]